MYLITNKEHLDEIPLSLNVLKGILSFRLSEFLKEYEVEDIVSFGAFIILESNTEINDFKAMMLTEPKQRRDNNVIPMLNYSLIRPYTLKKCFCRVLLPL